MDATAVTGRSAGLFFCSMQEGQVKKDEYVAPRVSADRNRRHTITQTRPKWPLAVALAMGVQELPFAVQMQPCVQMLCD